MVVSTAAAMVMVPVVVSAAAAMVVVLMVMSTATPMVMMPVIMSAVALVVMAVAVLMFILMVMATAMTLAGRTFYCLPFHFLQCLPLLFFHHMVKGHSKDLSDVGIV